ncbi:MAG: orotidine-5'-phosphate decarboxylase [Planctomycetota bacterium]|jgi:orotidine-5'-phosphate decarboxylase|nr:orotidine-5'-phosphate decarboxylase [Planctomycetota bacterium]
MADLFADRLAEAVLTKASPVVVGLDPDPARLPTEVLKGPSSGDPRADTAQAIRAFNEAVIEQIAPYACAVKPQIAYYEACGVPGIQAFEDTIQMAHDAGLLVISDIKRGDIGSTAKAYAAAHLLAPVSGDAITVNPYLGTDSIQPFLEACHTTGSGLFALVRTSNPSASEIQDLCVDGKPVHDHVAELVARWGEGLRGSCGYSSVGAVVGATAPAELAKLRALLPQTWFLIPGVGAQGGAAADVAPAFDSQGLGAVVNSSRGILYAFGDPSTENWRSPIANAARQLRDELADVRNKGPSLTTNRP